MVSKTTSYGLNKHSPQDFYDVNARNENWDKIDTELKKNANAVSERVKTTELAAEVKKVVKEGSLTAADLGAEKAGAAAEVEKKVDALGAGDVGADPTGAATDAVSTHNATADAHSTLFSKKQDKIKGKKGKYLGFTATDTVGEVDAPASGGSRITLTFASDFVGQAWTLSGGGETYTGTVDSSLTDTVSVLGIGTTYTLSAAIGGVTYTAEVTTKDYYTALEVTLYNSHVFGVCWDTSNSSTALTRLTRSTDPYGLVTISVATEPKPAVGTGAGSSPFDAFLPWSGMKECNLNNAGAVTAWKGDSGFSRSNNFTMVFIPEFYVAAKRSGTKQYFYVSDMPKAGMVKHPGSGKFVARYTGPGSKTGSNPMVNITRAIARSNAKKNGDKWHTFDFATLCAIVLLYIVEFADWNFRGKIGSGRTDANSVANSGATDTLTYHTGCTTAKTNKTGCVQYRWIENLWGNVFQWVDGYNVNNVDCYYCTEPSNYADDTTSGYTQIGTMDDYGWIYSLAVTDDGLMIPLERGGSTSTYIPVYMYSPANKKWHVLLVGGCWDKSTYHDLIYFGAGNESSHSHSSISIRLICEA